jgi:ribosomal protein S12 methylthiotransferase
MDSILNKVEIFDKENISEINIIGQDITGYGMDLYGTKRLPALLQKIIKKAGHINWIRLLYLYPAAPAIDELLELMKTSLKICKYIDLPLQHINDRILRLMRRNSTKKDILKVIDKIRKKIAGLALRTSLIVGFPSETDKEFRELLKFIEEVKFERLGVFIYSRQEGTAAYNFKKQIPKKIKIERFNEIMLKAQSVSKEINKSFLGKTIEVLIDEKEKGSYLGRTQYDAPEVDGLVYVSSKEELKPGDFVRVKITDTLEYDLVGEAVK